MTHADRSTRILMAGAVVSAVVHFAIATGFVRWSRLHGLEVGVRENPDARREESRPQPPEQAQPRKPIIRLGIDRSEANTLTWLGFETPTEHDGAKSTIEQSAMSPAPPGPPAASQPEPSPPPTASPEMQARAPEPQPPAPAPPVEAPATQEVLQGVRQTAAAITEAGKQLAAAAQDLAALLEKVPQPPAPSAKGPEHPDPAAPVRHDESPQTQVQAPAPQPAQPTPPSPAAQARGADGAPGIRADKESMATAIKKSPTAHPDGRVVAAQGLEIQTRRPRWEFTTMLTRRPRNPTVVITFRADGSVKSAEFARDGGRVYNSGYADVDEPLISAIYSWTAKGKALQEATQGDPDGTVTIMMTIILSG